MGDQSVYSDGCSVKSAVCFVDALTALGMTKLSLGMSVVRKVFYFHQHVFSRRCLRRKMLFMRSRWRIYWRHR